MTVRDSLFETSDSPTTTVRDDAGNAQSVETESSIITILWKFWWVAALAVVLFALLMRALFPVWAKKNEKELNQITKIADKSTAIVEKATRVNWLGAFKKKNLTNLKYVGTGLHPEYKRNPALKIKFFFAGEVFMMKDYVREADLLDPEDQARLNRKGGLNFPAYGISQSEASEYCAGLGASYRLPAYDELLLAERLARDKKKISLKRNLEFKAFETKDQWTSTIQPSVGWFSSLRTDDNFRIFSTNNHDGARYEDDGYDSETLSFRCVKIPEAD
ncbi:MAG: SUMF1/EgtB/PvdO family nonheme iron enzyme [Proteobacteria bacterium]|nr:SUMF1/EgtB/PvdO family nonheme iron enzyme [Pseudomonadota bacterium]